MAGKREGRGSVVNRDRGSVVKIDSSLLEKVDEFIQKEENRLKFVNKKQLIDIAVYEYLRKNQKTGKNAKKRGV